MPEPTGYQGYEGYGSLDWRRRIALEMMKKQQPYPKNVGEGIASAGGSLADALIAKQQREAEREYAGYERGVARELPPADTPYAPRGATAAPVARPTPSMSAAPTAGPNYFAGLPNSLQEQEDKYGPYGNSPSFNGASEEQPAPMPTTAPAATGETVPLPPPRPVYDRNRQIAEIEADPSLKPRLLAMARGEVGDDPAKQRVQLETAFNRAAARDQPLSQILLDTQTNPRLGYYPAKSFTRGQASEDVLTPVLRGSDEGGTALGFAPTGNASGGVASRGIASGRYGSAGRIGDETYVTQETPAQLARLEASRVPGAPLNIQPQAAGGIESGPRTFGGAYTQAVPPSAEVPFPLIGGLPTPNAGRDAIAAAIEPQPVPVQTAALPATTATDAAPERSALPPDATAQVEPRNPIITTDTVKKMPEPLPSQEPIPATSPPYVTKVRPEPKRPQPLAMSDAQQRALAVMNDPRLDPQGAAVRRATQVYNFQEGLRKELETQQQTDYVNERAKRDAEIVLEEKRRFEESDRALKEQTGRTDLEIKQNTARLAPLDLRVRQAEAALKEAEAAGIPDAIAKRKVELDKSRVDLSQAIQTLQKGMTQVEHTAGTILQRPSGDPNAPFTVAPGAPPMKDETTEMQGKARITLARMRPEVEALERAQNGKALTYFKDDVLAAKLPFGMDRKAVSDAYRAQRDAMMNFGTALMTHVSGAAYGKEEMERTLSSYWPKYGDTDADIAVKAERRRNIMASIGALGNDAQGRELVARTNFDYEARRAPLRITVSPKDADAEIGKLSPGRKYVAPDGTVRQVPFEEIRTR